MNARVLLIAFLATGLLLCGRTALAGTIISSVSETNGESSGIHVTGDTFSHADGNVSNPYTVPVFAEDVVSYTDRDHQWNGVTAAGLPSFLTGGDYVMTANNARDNDTYTLDVTLAQAAYVYLFRDNRDMGSIPAWYTDGVGIDLIDTTANVGNDNDGVGNGTSGPGVGVNDTMSVFMAVDTATGQPLLAAGTHQLLESRTASHGMYGVVASLEAPSGPDPSTPFDLVLDLGPQSQRVESGGVGVPDPSASTTPDNGNNGVSQIAMVDTGTGILTLSLSSLDWRDRGDGSSDALVALGEDFVKKNSGTIVAELGNLPAGTYSATTYHADADNTQSGMIEVFALDAKGYRKVGVGDASAAMGGVGDLTTAEVDGTKTTFTFRANGTDPVTIIMQGGGADTETPLSGLALSFEPGGPQPFCDESKINCQAASSPGYDGYLADTGQIFGDRGNGYSYGWDINMTGRARDRSTGAGLDGDAADERWDTLLHFKQGGGNDDGTYGTWEIEVPNGVYDVFIAAGDPTATDQLNTINVEGVLLEDLDGADMFDAFVANVRVSDGRLTIFSPFGPGDDALLGQGSNAKIAFINIMAVVPEPSTFVLCWLGLLGFALFGRRRRTR